MSLVLQEIDKQYIATNNGLEQVYQNKLVEGRDYERWDWLIGDYGTINTNKKISKFVLVAKPIEQIGKFFDFCIISYRTIGGSQNASNINIQHYTTSGYGVNIGYGSYSILIKLDETKKYEEVKIDVDFPSIIINDTYTGEYNALMPYPLRIFGTYPPNDNGNKKGIKYFKSDSLSLTPCKLLAPCPPNLSANGKAYPIGECGMIDSVSGKFYGNSGSGSFSVYNDPNLTIENQGKLLVNFP